MLFNSFAFPIFLAVAWMVYRRKLPGSSGCCSAVPFSTDAGDLVPHSHFCLHHQFPWPAH